MLTTFLLRSVSNLREFIPSRVRLARVSVQRLETELDCESTELAVEFVEKNGFQNLSFENTLGGQLSVRLVDDSDRVPYLTFKRGAQELLKELKHYDKSAHKLKKTTPAINKQEKVTQIVDESLVKSQDLTQPVQDCDDAGANKDRQGSGTKVFYYNEDRCATGRRFNELCRSTVSQLQFWMIKGLNEIDFTKNDLHTQEHILMKALLKTLLYYLLPMIQMVVEPILTTPDPVQHVQIAQKCHKAYLFLEETAKRRFDTSVLKELQTTLRMDWIDMVSILEGTNQLVINQHHKEEGRGLKARYAEILRSRFFILHHNHPLVRYEESSACRWRWDVPVAVQGVPLIPPENELQYTEHRPHFKVELYSSKMVLVSKPTPTEPKWNFPTTVTVSFNQQRILAKQWCSSENFIAIVWPSRLRFTTTEALMEVLGNASKQPEHQAEVDSTTLFENIWLPDPINFTDFSGNKCTYWRLLQKGILRFNSVRDIWVRGCNDFGVSSNNSPTYQMHYLDLSGSGQERTFSKFNLTTTLLANHPFIENHKFEDMSLIIKGENQFFFSLLEIADDMFIQTSPRNLHLARFAVKDKQLVSLEYSVFQFTTAQLAMMDKEWKSSFCNTGALQWIVKQNKYFSFAYLESAKFCMWVHVFHRNRFLPIGPRQRPVPGLTQFRMPTSLIPIQKETRNLLAAFSEKWQTLQRKKTVYRLFALTPQW